MNTNETTLHKRPNDTKITTVGHCMAFNHEPIPYHIIGYKSPRNDYVKKNQIINWSKLLTMIICDRLNR